MKQSKEQHKPITNKGAVGNIQTDSYTRLNKWFDKFENKGIYFFGGICLIYSLLLFNAKVSDANDDSMYIDAAFQYVKHFKTYFFTANAPLYPLLLSIPVSIFGLNLLILKFLSVILNFLHIIIFYKAFKKRLPNLIFFPVMLVISINSLMQYYASMTYSESLFMFLQASFFYAFFKLSDKLEAGEPFRQSYKQWLLLGFIMVILGYTRSVAIVICPAVVLLFLFQKQYWNAVYTIGVFFAFKLPLELIKFGIWGSRSQFANQGKLLLLKDPYDTSQGNDDAFGFFMRFIDNSNGYLSKRFFQIIGFMSESTVTVSGTLTVFVYALLVLGGIQLIRANNKKLLIVPFYCFAIMITSFVVLQASWDQARIILVCVPFMLILIFYGLYQLVKKTSFSQNFFLIAVLFVCSSVFISSTKKGIKNLPIVSKNLKGDIYYGYTPDWVNFLKASEWCGTNLPATCKVASRKAPMSFIYGKGMQFYPVYSIIYKDSVTNQSNPDSVLATFKKNGVTHFLLSNLRQNPTKANGNIINTMNNVVGPIAQKYPQKLKMIQQIGDLEPTYIYEINY
jgi:hypothetical protein